MAIQFFTNFGKAYFSFSPTEKMDDLVCGSSILLVFKLLLEAENYF